MEGSRVSHLAADWGEAAASVALPRWSPSLLLYKGREVGDLMSGFADCDGEEETDGFEVVERSSIVPVLSVLSTGSQWKLWERGFGREMCGSGRGSWYELGESGR